MPVVSGSSTGIPSLPIGDLVEILRQQAGDHPSRTVLSDGMNAGDTTLNVSDGSRIPENGLVEIELEVMRVVSTVDTDSFEVVRAQQGSDPVSHSTGSEVITQFRHPRMEYLRAINRALDMISIAFGKVVWDESQSFTTTRSVFEIPATAMRVVDVAYQDSNGRFRSIPFRPLMNVPTAVSSTGKAIGLTAWTPGGETAYIAYETPWANYTLLAEVIEDEFPAEAFDLIEMGARLYLADAEAFAQISFVHPHTLAKGEPDFSRVRTLSRDLLVAFLARRDTLSSKYRRARYHQLIG